MNNDEKIIIYRETLAQSVFSDSLTCVMLCFCVYVSNDSTWWTLVTGLMFIIFLFMKAGVVTKVLKHEVIGKQALIDYANNLED